MKRKVLGFFVSLLAVAILALPMSVVSATKPQEIVFYQIAFSGTGTTVSDYAGESDNYFMAFTGTQSKFYWDWNGMSLTNEMGEGNFIGIWILHGFTPPLSYESRNGYGTTTIEVTDWGEGGETGTIVIRASSGKWHIISGTIGGRNVHGGGIERFLGVTFPDFNIIMEYAGTIHFDP